MILFGNELTSKGWVPYTINTESEMFVPSVRVKKSMEKATVSQANLELSAKRYAICKTCDKSTESGHRCSLHKGCCFGRWRSKPESKCYSGKW